MIATSLAGSEVRTGLNFTDSLTELFAGSEMGEDALRVLRECPKFRQRIHCTITPLELEDLNRFEAAQPKACTKCNAPVRSLFMPSQIAHDVEQCQPKPPATTAKP